MRALLGLALLFPAGLALAEPGDIWAVATVGSHHFTTEKFNQHNYGFGFESPSRFARLSFIGGAYDNSYNKASAYAGVTWTPLAVGPVHLGAIAGFLSGYASRPIPAILPTAQVERGRFGANIYYAPKVSRDDCAVLGFQLKAKF